jgi:aspartyl-tRNA(Asn)/glutamyl-tRNA(Gln) amidotransferase subunit B
MRLKDSANDYRYFFESDIPVFIPDAEFLKSVEDSLVELPAERAKRFMSDFELSAEQADLIISEKETSDYFEDAVKNAIAKGLEKKDASNRVSNYLLTVIMFMLNREGLGADYLPSFALTPKRLAEICALVSKGLVSSKNAKEAMEISVAENRDPAEIIKEKGWELLSDPNVIAAAVSEVESEEGETFTEAATTENPKRRQTLIAYLTGMAIKKTGGRADPKITKECVEKLVNEKANV